MEQAPDPAPHPWPVLDRGFGRGPQARVQPDLRSPGDSSVDSIVAAT
jgi:hypothetical protein